MKAINVRLSVLLLIIAFVFSFSSPSSQAATEPMRKLIAAEGNGYLETVDGYPVLHLKGTPEEMGFQHGVLLKEAVRQNVGFLLKDGMEGGIEVGSVKILRAMIASVLVGVFENRIPQRFVQEMRALAKGSQLPESTIIAANLIPELMHCSGFALLRGAVAEGKLYHGRVLDYGVDIKLQEHAVLIVQEPDGKVPFVNVSYAGFIGSVTGMNLEQISIGEMGGGGVGNWNGIPMTFLVRMVLADARTLDEAIGIFKGNPRTCEYFYVIADAKTDSAIGMKAVPEKVEIIKPGEKHELLPNPVKNTVLMSAGSRYKNLARLVAEGYSKFTQASAIRLMDAPVAMKSNLHNALMIPADGIIYVANADKDGRPAWKQKYYRFDLHKLLSERPRPD